jgi:hypothetical protein
MWISIRFGKAGWPAMRAHGISVGSHSTIDFGRLMRKRSDARPSRAPEGRRTAADVLFLLCPWSFQEDGLHISAVGKTKDRGWKEDLDFCAGAQSPKFKSPLVGTGSGLTLPV